MSTVAALMVRVGADISDAINGLNRVEQKVGNFAQRAGGGLRQVGQGFTDVGRKASMMALPVAAGMGLAIKTAADFEQQMKILNITMRDSGITGEQWSQVALKIGADADLVGISAAEAADAITNFGKAGLETNQILGDMQGYLAGTEPLAGALRAAIDLAAASELDLAAASDAVVQTMNQYGLSFEQATPIMDHFVRAADASTASVEDLVEAHGNVGPVMAQLGFSVQDANVMLAELADRGIAGAEAGTTLKSMFLNMTNPATKAGDALAELGVRLYDTNGNMRDAQSIVSDLSNALDENAKMTIMQGGASEEQAKNITKYSREIEKLNTRIYEYENGLKGVNLSEKKRAEKLSQLREQQANYRTELQKIMDVVPEATSALVDMTDAQRNSYLQAIAGSYGIKALNILVDEGAIGWEEYEKAIEGATSMQEQAAARTEGFHAAMEQFKSVLETFMITAATPFLNEFLTPFLRNAGELIQKVMDVNPGFAKMAFAIGGIIVVAGPLLILIGQIISAIGLIASVISGAISIITGFAGAIAGVIGAIASVGLPVLAVIAVAIAAVVAAVVLLRKAWEENFLGIRDALMPVVEIVQKAFEYIKFIVKSFGDFLKGEITWEQFVDRARFAMWRIKQLMIEAWGKLKEATWQIFTEIGRIIVDKLAEFIGPLVGGTENAKRIIMDAFANVRDFLADVWEGIKTAAEGAWEFIQGKAWTDIQTAIGDAWTEIKSGITGAIEEIGPELKTAWDTFRKDAETKWGEVKTAIGDKWEEIRTSATTKWGEIQTKIGDVVTAVAGFVSGPLKTAIDTAVGLFKGLLSRIFGGGDEGGSAFDLDFTELITNLANLRTEYTTTKTHIETQLNAIITKTDEWLSTSSETSIDRNHKLAHGD